MTQDKTSGQPPKGSQSREDRLKSALKANLGRRKAQARAKAAKTQGEAQDKGQS
jgi:hypothetical protein